MVAKETEKDLNRDTVIGRLKIDEFWRSRANQKDKKRLQKAEITVRHESPSKFPDSG